MGEKRDIVVVGSGFAGAVVAEMCASLLGRRVLLLERRPRLGGNAADALHESGFLVHLHGPHIFHTDDEKVFRYLSRFTEWRPYEHRVMTVVDGKLLPFPINLDTINALYGLSLTEEECRDFLEEAREEKGNPTNLEEHLLSLVGKDLYEKFYRKYTEKMWGVPCRKLSPRVVGRIPVRTNREDRYFTDRFQFMPAEGFTALFERMLSHENIEVVTGVDFREVRGDLSWKILVYTGPIDEYFDFSEGKLPYRSLQFRYEVREVEWHQPVAVVNYPGDEPFTRVTEYKHLTAQESSRTILCYEYPTGEGEPYYPLVSDEAEAQAEKYRERARREKGVFFVGRLAEYRYVTMEEVIRRAFQVFEEIRRALT